MRLSMSFDAFCLFEEMASTSSMKSTQGAQATACSKTSRILSSDSPETPAINSVAGISIRAIPNC